MVEFTNKTARKDITIKKATYSIPTPFTEGHVCTANEANALNQLLAENCRNNFSSRFKEDAPVPTQKEFDAYVAQYQFGVRSVATTDPVEKQMRKMVEAKFLAMLKARGQTKSILSSDEYKNAIDAAVEKNRDKLYPIAKEIVMKAAVEVDLDL